MTLILDLDLYIIKLYLCTKNEICRSRLSKVREQAGQTNRDRRAAFAGGKNTFGFYLYIRGVVLYGTYVHVDTTSERTETRGRVISSGQLLTYVNLPSSTLCLKKVPTFKLSLTLSNLNRFSKFLHHWKAYEICYKTCTTLSTSP